MVAAINVIDMLAFMHAWSAIYRNPVFATKYIWILLRYAERFLSAYVFDRISYLVDLRVAVD